MPKRKSVRRGRTWEGEVWKWGTDICPRATGPTAKPLPSWITKSHKPDVYTRVRIVKILPKKSAKKGHKQ